MIKMAKGPLRRFLTEGRTALTFKTSYKIPVEVTEEIKNTVTDDVAGKLKRLTDIPIDFVEARVVPRRGQQEMTLKVYTNAKQLTDKDEDILKDIIKTQLIMNVPDIHTEDDIKYLNYTWESRIK